MPESQYAYSLEKRQEQFSFAYLRAIASVAGYKMVRVDEIDEDSVDVQISQKRDGLKWPDYPTLSIQAKCTYHTKPKTDGSLSFRLKAKNYDDLRQVTGMPFILVVVCLPEKDEHKWLLENDDSMSLYNVAYWTCLRGKSKLPPSKTDYKARTHTISIPASQRFDVKSLTRIMDGLAIGRFPNESTNR